MCVCVCVCVICKHFEITLLKEPELIFLQSVKCFQVFPYNRNYSKHY